MVKVYIQPPLSPTDGEEIRSWLQEQPFWVFTEQQFSNRDPLASWGTLWGFKWGACQFCFFNETDAMSFREKWTGRFTLTATREPQAPDA